MAFTISYVYEATDQFTPTIRRISFFIERLNRRLRITGQLFTQMQGNMSAVNNSMRALGSTLNANAAALREAMHAAREYERQVETLVQSLRELRDTRPPPPIDTDSGGGGPRNRGAGGLAAGLGAFIGGSAVASFTKDIFDAAASVDAVEKSLGRMLRSGEKTADLMGFMQERTKNTIFSVSEMGAVAKKMLAVGVSFDDLKGSMQLVMDLAAGSGQNFGELGLVFSQVKAKGKLMAEEVLQFAERGISIVPILADLWGVSIAEATKAITDGKIGFERFEEALTKLTDKGSKWGMFANASEKATKQMDGAFKMVVTSLTILKAELGLAANELFGIAEGMGVVSTFLFKVAEGLREFAKTHPIIVKATILFFGLFIVVGLLAAAIAAVVAGLAIIGAPILKTIALIAAGVTLLILLFTDLKNFVIGVGFAMMEPFLLVLDLVDRLIGLPDVMKRTLHQLSKQKRAFDEERAREEKGREQTRAEKEEKAEVRITIVDPGSNVGQVETTSGSTLDPRVGRTMW